MHFAVDIIRLHRESIMNRKIHPTVGLATVYKTLQILAEQGLIQELDFQASQARFDLEWKFR